MFSNSGQWFIECLTKQDDMFELMVSTKKKYQTPILELLFRIALEIYPEGGLTKHPFSKKMLINSSLLGTILCM